MPDMNRKILDYYGADDIGEICEGGELLDGVMPAFCTDPECEGVIDDGEPDLVCRCPECGKRMVSMAHALGVI